MLDNFYCNVIITLGLLVLTLALFTINSLKNTSAYKSDTYDHYLLTLLTFELVVMQISIIL
ncbi:hypothetical protein CN639_10215 [Bacillus toyonensis]|nr:hypothetical protein CN906_12595 [Bacillus toyonensis]PEK55044.1 hypothetical protein CN588_00035 [Bacillus toyonensis]PEM90698.1 hypothetical protein CN639_10215 [Bacillus toyonensis]PEN70946.1 hypothetical protein CN545_12970 [Bacillus toyonensis]PFZ41376.1 hypothetical protein COL64_02065 [Bacillus toyonensis]